MMQFRVQNVLLLWRHRVAERSERWHYHDGDMTVFSLLARFLSHCLAQPWFEFRLPFPCIVIAEKDDIEDMREED